MYWVNGEPQNFVNANDRAIQFGDGCFTTLAVKHQQPIMLSAHLNRLHQGCEALFLPNPDWQQLKSHLLDIAAKTSSNAVIKVIISRGEGGRGYSAKGGAAPTVIVSLTPFPTHYQQQQSDGITLGISPIMLGKNPQLAGIKHLNRLEQVLIKHHLEQTHFDDVLVCDNEGYLIEANAANLFWRQGNQLFTPDLTTSGVNGMMRQAILQFASQLNWQINIVREKPETLHHADEIWLSNALMPVIAVNNLYFSDDKCYAYPNRDYYHIVLQHCLSLQ